MANVIVQQYVSISANKWCWTKVSPPLLPLYRVTVKSKSPELTQQKQQSEDLPLERKQKDGETMDMNYFTSNRFTISPFIALLFRNFLPRLFFVPPLPSPSWQLLWVIISLRSSGLQLLLLFINGRVNWTWPDLSRSTPSLSSSYPSSSPNHVSLSATHSPTRRPNKMKWIVKLRHVNRWALKLM